MFKKIQAETMAFLRIFVMFLYLMMSAHSVGAEGASENYLSVDGDKYHIGSYSTPDTDMSESVSEIVGGLVSTDSSDTKLVGGTATSGDASTNGIYVKNSKNRRIYGALISVAGMDNATNNFVSVSGEVENSTVYGGYVAGDGTATNNNVTVNNYSYDGTQNATNVSGNIYGGYTEGSGNVSSNWINIGIQNTSSKVESVTGNIYGGYAAGSGNVENNGAHVIGSVNGNVYGGYTNGNGDASSNYATVQNSEITTQSHYSYNGNDYNNDFTYYSNGDITGNIYGGYSTGSGNAELNIAHVAGTVNGDVYGGYTENGNASSNYVSVYSAKYTGNSTVNYSTVGYEVSQTTSSSSQGSVTGNIYGGYAAGSGSANNNFAYFDSSLDDYKYSYMSDNGNYEYSYSYAPINVGGDIYGGYAAGTGSTNNNNIYLYGKVDLSSSNIYGGYSASGAMEGNTLTVLGSGNKAKSVNNFQNMNFILNIGNLNTDSLGDLTYEQKESVTNQYEAFRKSHEVSNGDTMLTVETANIQGTSIKSYVSGDTTLTEGDKITLIDAQTLNTDGNTSYNGYLAEGISFNHKLNVTQDGNKIIATIDNGSTPTTNDIPAINTDPITPVTPTTPTEPTTPTTPTEPTTPTTPTEPEESTPTLLEQTTIIPAPAVTAPKMLTAHMDSTLNWLPSEDFAMPSSGNESSESNEESESSKELGMDAQAEKPGFEIFGNLGTSNIRTNTGNGSYVDSKTNGINLGFARRFDSENGSRTYIAPLFDFGGGSYESYLGNGIHGKGHTHFTTGGIIARRALKNGFYYESSFRMGKTTMDFATDDLMQGDEYPHVAYNSSASVWAAHLHLGRRIEFSPVDVLNVYGIYFHTRQGSMDAKLTTGETYHFNSVTNQRLRVGARLLKWANPNSVFYSGIAYQWESAGAANATYKDQTTHNVGAAGSSLMLELGWQVKPVKTSNIGLDIGAVGWLGHQRGASAHVKFNYAF